MSIPEKEIDWKALARSLTANAGMAVPAPEVREWLNGSQGKRLLVACSGGADSIFLLCLLWGYRAEWDLELVVGHYNHAWRGGESDGDASFVEEVARGLSCEYSTEKCAGEKVSHTETGARDQRLGFLRETAARMRCEAIALGHQRDDILETQLQRLARGAGLEGLAAPRPVHIFEGGLPVHLRPLLDLSASRIREALKGAGIPWREDRSNGDVTIARNALRADFIPNLSEMLGRDVQAGAARTRRLLEADAMALSEAARAALPAAYAGAEVLNRADFKGLPEALGRRALRAWLQKRQVYGSLSAAGFDRLLGAVLGEEEKGCRSAGEEFVVFDEARIWCEGSIKNLAGPAACSLKINGEERLSTGAVLNGEWVEVDPALMARLADGKVDPFTECFAALPDGTEELQVRGLMAGDRYRALGAPGSRKLKDCLMDRGLSERERKLLPVVCLKEHEIIWVPGLPVLDAYRLRPESKRALRLTYRQGEAL